MTRSPLAASAAALLALFTAPALAESETPRWTPFGGEMHAFFTVATDYAQAGISATQNQPAFQAGVDWHSWALLGPDAPRLRFYTSVIGTTVSFPNAGAGEEIDLAGGFKLNLFDRRLLIDAGYIRYLYPSYASTLGFEFGEVSGKIDYDFGPLIVSARLRWSPDTILHAGETWNKRALVTVPLDFLPLPDGVRMKAYASLGNVWTAKPDVLALPGNDYWYWQGGLVTSVWGLDFSFVYTDTNIEAEHCGFTRACEGRFLASVTKVF